MPGPVPTLWAASLRHFLRQPAQLALALVALAAGVATIVAVNIATASSRRAFELSMRAVNGPATQVITGGPQGLDETLYVRLFTRAPLGGGPQPVYAPVVEGYVTVRGRVMQLVGLDPFASAALQESSASEGEGTVRTLQGVPSWTAGLDAIRSAKLVSRSRARSSWRTAPHASWDSGQASR